eukprot:4986615-Prorocentrum_lima.AAC.1
MTLPPYTTTGLGAEVRGSSHVTKGKWLNFDGTKCRARTRGCTRGAVCKNWQRKLPKPPPWQCTCK